MYFYRNLCRKFNRNFQLLLSNMFSKNIFKPKLFVNNVCNSSVRNCGGGAFYGFSTQLNDSPILRIFRKWQKNGIHSVIFCIFEAKPTPVLVFLPCLTCIFSLLVRKMEYYLHQPSCEDELSSHPHSPILLPPPNLIWVSL